MRIKLKRGKQRELIELSKGGMNWNELANKLELSAGYLRNELRHGERLLPENVYLMLCKFANQDYSLFIEERLDDNWGRSKGGKNSAGSYFKHIKMPENSAELAEFIGIMLGDGHLCKLKAYKIGTYEIRVVGDSRYDREYLVKYVKPLIENLFDVKVRLLKYKNANALALCANGRLLVEFLENKGLIPGDKIKTRVTIPDWVRQNKNYLRACVRGLIDTDGSVFRMSNKDPNLLRISFTNYNKRLLNDARASLINLGFSPSKIIRERQFFISKQAEIWKYLKEIGFSNIKHFNKAKVIQSPVV